MYWIMYASVSHKYYLRFLAKDFHNNTLCRKKLEDVKGIRVEVVHRQTDIQYNDQIKQDERANNDTQNTIHRTPIVQHELHFLPFRSTWVHPPVFSRVRVTRSLALYVCFVNRCLSFCTFSLAIVFSVLLRYTDSDCAFGIVKLLSLNTGDYGLPVCHFRVWVVQITSSISRRILDDERYSQKCYLTYQF